MAKSISQCTIEIVYTAIAGYKLQKMMAKDKSKLPLNSKGNRRGMNPNSYHGKSSGRPLLKSEKKEDISLTLTPSIIDFLRYLARQKKTSVSEVVEQIVQAFENEEFKLK